MTPAIQIIGLAGVGSVGKDTVSRHLEKKFGFTHVSSSDLIRAYMRKNNLGEETRSALQKAANDIRSQNGPDYLVTLALQNTARPIVISGLRALKEAERVQKEGGIIIALTAPIEIRYKWAVGRGGIEDKLSFEEFKRIEEKELENKEEAAQNIKGIMAIADVHVENTGSRSLLLQKIDQIIENGRLSS